jgi:hypothetical protein
MGPSLNSGAQEPLSYDKWYLPVGPLYCVNVSLLGGPTPVSSWEYFTTLDYEFDIIRGRRPCRRTTWVRKRRRSC